MIERFHIKTTRPDKEMFYFDKDKGIYMPDGNITIEEKLELSYKNANSLYRMAIENLGKRYEHIEGMSIFS
jgi:hypothetical protein